MTCTLTPAQRAALIAAIEPLAGLGAGVFAAGDEVCALGALGLRARTRDDITDQPWCRAKELGLALWDTTQSTEWATAPQEDHWRLAPAGVDVGDANDGDDDEVSEDETPVERRARMLAWLREGA